jgi:competence protein ComEA
VEPLAPDWRAIGEPPPPGPGHQGGAASHPMPSARTITLAVGAFVATVLLGAVIALLLMPTGGSVVIDTGDPSGGGAVDLSAQGAARGAAQDLIADTGSIGVVVDVEGAVARPGLVRVPPGGRVGDALDLAGGFAPSADLTAAADVLNLAQEATDGLKIMVPAMGDEPPAAGGAPDGHPATGGLVDLNRATESELDGLPGVGPATIAKIVAAREEAPFRSIDELRSRGVVGEAAFGKLRDLVTVGR